MKSATLPSFWISYNNLSQAVKLEARKAYSLWERNPFHPSLHFKCSNREQDSWSVRITQRYRAVGTLDADTVTWFWIGDHDDYRRFFAGRR